MECHAVNKISKTVTDSFINVAYVHYYRNSSIISLMDLYTMDWQLPDIGKTITNTILPSSLSAYTVRISSTFSHGERYPESSSVTELLN